MSHISRPEVTLISGPVIEENGTERLYVGAYVPETAPVEQRMRVQECIGFLAVPDRDPTTYPQPRDGWIVRPARMDEETIESVAKSVPAVSRYEHQTRPVSLKGLEILVGRTAIDPRKKSDQFPASA